MKSSRAQKKPESFEVGPVDGVVGPVPAVDLVGEGNRAVGGDVQPEDELLEVRPMVLVEAMDDAGLVQAGLVAAMDGDGGRIVMDPPGVDLEAADDLDGQPEKRLRPRTEARSSSTRPIRSSFKARFSSLVKPRVAGSIGSAHWAMRYIGAGDNKMFWTRTARVWAWSRSPSRERPRLALTRRKKSMRARKWRRMGWRAEGMDGQSGFANLGCGVRRLALYT